MARAPLDELLLQAALMGVAAPAAFLGRALQPPRAAAIEAAMRNLVELQALAPAPAASEPTDAWADLGPNPNRPDASANGRGRSRGGGGNYTLTPLGVHLASLHVASASSGAPPQP